MICYAIKNNNGEYFGIDRDAQWFWEEKILFAYFFRDMGKSNGKLLATNFRNNHFPKCKVVKVEIKEIEDGKINL